MEFIRYILLACLILGILIYIYHYAWALWPTGRARSAARLFGHRYPLDRHDAAAVAAILVLWAIIGFWGLGDREAPQSFHTFTDESVEIDLGGEIQLSRLAYYSGLGTGSYLLEFSTDGESWAAQQTTDEETGEVQQAMAQSHANLFKWLEADLGDEPPTVRYIRLSAWEGELWLGELGVYDGDGNLLDAGRFQVTWSRQVEDGDALFDEQDLVPERASYLNSAYFDEIYHARTAYEHTENLRPYEISHPPLGKIIISIGIQLFGMTPFGWRFMGVLFGTVMLACLYMLIKCMFGKRLVAICGTLLFAFDFMHYVQTRIATIDTYAVFFIILMYFFLYRYISLDYETPFRKTLPPLLLCGLCFGLGAACKWTSMYAGIGLAALYAVYQVLRGIHWCRSGRTAAYVRYLLATVGVSLLFFLLVPAVIYYLSYIPYGRYYENPLISRDYLDMVIDNQTYMFNYHRGMTSEHPYSSRWYQWVVDARPILYYRDYLGDGTKSAFSAFGNPAVYWGGLAAMLTLPFSLVRRRDGRALVILVGYFSLLVPWLVISRPTFAYHYFTNTIFLVLALSYTFNGLLELDTGTGPDPQIGRGRGRVLVLAYTLVTIFLFFLFYPSLSGMPVPYWYTDNILKWLPSWPL